MLIKIAQIIRDKSDVVSLAAVRRSSDRRYIDRKQRQNILIGAAKEYFIDRKPLSLILHNKILSQGFACVSKTLGIANGVALEKK